MRSPVWLGIDRLIAGDLFGVLHAPGSHGRSSQSSSVLWVAPPSAFVRVVRQLIGNYWTTLTT
jgi:hypothetical protein